MLQKILFSLSLYLFSTLSTLATDSQTPSSVDQWTACDLKFSIIKSGELIALPRMLAKEGVFSQIIVKGDKSGYKLKSMVTGLDKKNDTLTITVQLFEMVKGSWKEKSTPVFKIPLPYLEDKYKEKNLNDISDLTGTSYPMDHDVSYENDDIMINLALMPLTETDLVKITDKQ